MESLPGRILSLMMLPLSSAEEKTSVGDDEFPEKKGTGWSGHIVELDSVAMAAESLARQVSLMLLLFSSTEEKTSVGDDKLPEKNGTGWSGCIVELDPVAIAAEFPARQILSVMMVPFSSAKEKTSVGGDGFPEKKRASWSGHIVEPNPIAVATKSLASRMVSLMLLPLSSAAEKTRIGGDESPEKNGTGWSSHVVELDPVAIAVESSAR